MKKYRIAMAAATISLAASGAAASVPAHASDSARHSSISTADIDNPNNAIVEGPGGTDKIDTYAVNMTNSSASTGFMGTASNDNSGGKLVEPDSVIGKDQRKRVQSTTHYPARAVVAIHSNFGPCSGFFISKRTIVTAGHCVYEPRAEEGHHWAKDVYVWPGRNGTSEPYGSCHPKHTYIPHGWEYGGEGSSTSYDYAAIQLDCNTGSKTGWFGFRGPKDGEKGYITGYPADKKPRFSQWWATGSFHLLSGFAIHYLIDTTAGQSGSPAVVNGCGARCAIGNHSDGHTSGNSGPGYDGAVRSFLNKYK